MKPAPALYHGGSPGLEVGDRLLSPIETGLGGMTEGGSIACRRDRVYATISVEDAAVYAAAAPPAGRGDVYEVRLDQPLEHDPDCRTVGYSFQSPAATVVRVVRRGVRFDAEVFANALASFGFDELDEEAILS